MDELTFEKAMEKLEEINEKLQDGNCPLQQAIDLYSEGLKLANYCKDKLQQATNQLNELNKGDQND